MRKFRLSGWRGLLAASLVVAIGGGCGVFRPSDAGLIETARTGPTAEARRDALVALKGNVQPWMRPSLESVLSGELDAAGRALAAEMLGELGDPASVEELRASVRTDVSPLVREKALAALARIEGPDAEGELARVLAEDPDTQVRVAALELARRHLPRERAQRLLVDALDDASPKSVRVQAQLMLEDLTGLSAPPRRDEWLEALQPQ